jgi:hypothetical protein
MGGINAEAGDAGNAAAAKDGPELDRAEAAVGHQHQ